MMIFLLGFSLVGLNLSFLFLDFSFFGHCLSYFGHGFSLFGFTVNVIGFSLNIIGLGLMSLRDLFLFSLFGFVNFSSSSWSVNRDVNINTKRVQSCPDCLANI